MKRNQILLFVSLPLIIILSGCGGDKVEAPQPEMETSAPAAPPEPVRGEEFELVAKAPLGKKLTESLSMESEVVDGEGKAMVKLTVDQGVTQAFESEKDGALQGVFTVRSLKMSQKLGDQGWEYDSSVDVKDSTSPIAKDLKRVLDEPLQYSVDPGGRVTGFGNYDLFSRKILPRTASRMGRSVITGLYSVSSLKDMVYQYDVLPTNAVAVGDMWPVKKIITVGPMANLAIEMKYTFEGMEEKDGMELAVVVGRGEIRLPEGTIKPEGQAPQDGGSQESSEPQGSGELSAADQAEMAEQMAALEGEIVDDGNVEPDSGSEPAPAAPAPEAADPNRLGTVESRILFDRDRGLIIERGATTKVTFPGVQGAPSRGVHVQATARMTALEDLPAGN